MIKAEIKAVEEETGLAVEAIPSRQKKQLVTELTCIKAYDIRVAAGETNEAELRQWISDHITRYSVTVSRCKK